MRSGIIVGCDLFAIVCPDWGGRVTPTPTVYLCCFIWGYVVSLCQLVKLFFDASDVGCHLALLSLFGGGVKTLESSGVGWRALCYGVQ